jgi:hypothetical protein
MSDDSQNETSSSLLAGRRPIIILGALIVVSVIAVCALGYSLINSSGIDLPGGLNVGEESDSEPTPFAPAVGQQPSGGESIVYGISDSSTVSVTLDIPVTLAVGERDFIVLPQTINSDGSWSPGISSNDSAGWVHGSVINYIMALQSTGENADLLRSLTPGSEVVMTTQNGSDFVFEVEGSRQVEVGDQSIFTQLAPGLTLMLMDDQDGERLVVDGRYVINDSPSRSGGSEVSTEVGVGEPVQLDNLQVTLNNVTYTPDHPEAPPGFAFFILDGVLQNTSSSTVDLGTLQVVLIDETGNRYVLNPVAATLGENAPLTGGFLAAGQSMPFTVGYQLPVGLTSTMLTAQVVRQDTGAGVQIRIPFSARNAAETTNVALQSVEVSEDLTSLIMSGQITNNGGQPVVVAQSDVTLRTPDGASYLVLSSNPPFPWTIPAGQTLLYTVTFQRPVASDSAVFTVLNQPFQLNNLQ